MSTEQPLSDPTTLAARVWRAGRTAWALVGIAVAVVLVGLVAAQVRLVLVALVLALFPATLLVPVSNWLKRRNTPASLAAAFALVGGILLILLVLGGMVPLVLADLPELTASAREGLAELEAFLEEGPLGLEVGGLAGLVERGREQLGELGDLTGPAIQAAATAAETIAGFVLMLVILFFYLKDGARLGSGIVATVPASVRPQVRAIGERAWATLGAYFRGQLLVALVDAVAIGAGLLLLGIPLAIPLAVLIFFGGLFPIVGAVVTGILAVLVALAHGGLVMGLVVAGLVLLVQQLESNVLQPVILGRAIELHAVVVLLSITTGAITLGLLGAFLGVPIAAIVARALDYLRSDRSDAAAQPAG